MSTHAICKSFNECGAFSSASARKSYPSNCQYRKHVVTVYPDTRKTKTRSALVQRHLRLTLNRLANGPLIVLAEEDHWCVIHRCKCKCFVHIALTGSAITKVSDNCIVTFIALNSHGVTGGMQCLRADYQRVEMEVVIVRIPTAMIYAAVHPEKFFWWHTLRPCDTVFAIGGECIVAGNQCAARSHLCGFLSE